MSFDEDQQRPGTAASNNGPSPYHRDEAPFGHNHCPNCGEAYPPELLFPTKVGRIVQVVWKQNKQEKQAAKDLSRHSPRELLQNIQRQHEEQRQLQLQMNATNAGDNNNNNIGTTQKDSLDALLAHADDDLNALVPSTLYNIKSPDWTDLPPCIARFRLSLFQLRLNNKMMEKMTSLCENCFSSFFPGEDPACQNQQSTSSPSKGGLLTISTSSSTNNNNNSSKRSPMKPPISFEYYLAQSRFPDRAKDFAFSDVGRTMRHAATEAKAKQDIRNSLFSHIDRAQEMINVSATASPLLMLNNSALPNNNNNTDENGGVTWTNENNNNNNIFSKAIMGSRHGSMTNDMMMMIPTSPNTTSKHSRIRFLLGNQTSLASVIERQALDPLPVSILDVPFADWLQRELWDEMNKVVEFGKDISCTSAYTHDPEFPGEDVPPAHPFFELYSRNRMRLPTPASRWLNTIANETSTATFENIRVNRWRPKPGFSKQQNQQQQRRAMSSPTTVITSNSNNKNKSANNNNNNSNSNNNVSTKSSASLASALLSAKIDQSFFKDQQIARDLSIPQNLNDSERKCLIEIMSGQNLGDAATCTRDFNDNKKLLKINGLKKSHQVLWMVNNDNNSNGTASATNAFGGGGGGVRSSTSPTNPFGNSNTASSATVTSTSKNASAWDAGYRFESNNSDQLHHANNKNVSPHNMNQDLPSAIEDFLDSS